MSVPILDLSSQQVCNVIHINDKPSLSNVLFFSRYEQCCLCVGVREETQTVEAAPQSLWSHRHCHMLGSRHHMEHCRLRYDHGCTSDIVTLCIISGSRDTTAIIWDLSRWTYIKNLPGHAGPVACVNINELTGDIVTCAGSWLYLWDVNGNIVSRVDTGQAQILCVAQVGILTSHWSVAVNTGL